MQRKDIIDDVIENGYVCSECSTCKPFTDPQNYECSLQKRLFRFIDDRFKPDYLKAADKAKEDK